MNIADFKNRFRTHSVASDTALNDSGVLADVVGWDSGGYGYHYCYGIPITISNKIKKFNLTITLELYKGYSKTYSRELCAWISTTKYETTKSNIQFDLLMNELKLAKENDEYNSKKIKFELGVSEKGIPKTFTQTIERELEPGQYYIYIYDEGIFGVSAAKTSLHYLRNLVFDIGQKISYYLTGFKEGNRLIKEEIDEDIFTKEYVNYSSYLFNYNIKGFKGASSIFLINKNGGRQEYLSDTEFQVTGFILDSTVELYYNPIEYSISYSYDNEFLIPENLVNNNSTTYTIIQGPKFEAAYFTGYTCNDWYFENSKVTGINENQLEDLNNLEDRVIGDINIVGIFMPNLYTYILSPQSSSGRQLQYEEEKKITASFDSSKTFQNKDLLIEHYQLAADPITILWNKAENDYIQKILYNPINYTITYKYQKDINAEQKSFTIEDSIPFKLWTPYILQGYKFLGWSNIKPVSGEIYQFSSQSDIDIEIYNDFNFEINNLSLYAVYLRDNIKYKEIHKIQSNFDSKEKIYEIYSSKDFIVKSNTTIEKQPFDIEGYSLTIWSGGDSNSIIPNSDNSTIIEYYYDRNTYSYEFNGENKTFYYEEKIQLEYSETIPQGYEVVWYMKNTTTNIDSIKVHTGPIYIFTMPANGIQIIVNLEPIKYSLAFILNGGTITGDLPKSYTINSESISINNPTKTLNNKDITATFKYWDVNTDSQNYKIEATEDSTIIIEEGSIGNRVYTAYYEYKQGDKIIAIKGSGKIISVKGDSAWKNPYTI